MKTKILFTLFISSMFLLFSLKSFAYEPTYYNAKFDKFPTTKSAAIKHLLDINLYPDSDSCSGLASDGNPCYAEIKINRSYSVNISSDVPGFKSTIEMYCHGEISACPAPLTYYLTKDEYDNLVNNGNLINNFTFSIKTSESSGFIDFIPQITFDIPAYSNLYNLISMKYKMPLTESLMPPLPSPNYIINSCTPADASSVTCKLMKTN